MIRDWGKIETRADGWRRDGEVKYRTGKKRDEWTGKSG